MSKGKIMWVMSIGILLIFSLFLLPACKEEVGQEAIIETVTETITETITETVEVEATESPYTYEKLRGMAIEGVYEGEPAKDYTIAFANFLTSFPFCKSVQDGIIEQWKLAGGSEDNLIILDNAADSTIAVQNADIIFSKKPDAFIEFQFDARVNAMIGKRAEELGIFVIAVDIPVPGFPFMGVDNYGTAVLTGEWATDQIDVVYGSWENVDRVFFLYQTMSGETVYLRSIGSVDVFKDTFGEDADPDLDNSKAEMVEVGATTDETQAAFADILSAYPEDENFVVFCLNDQAAAGVQAAADIAGRWNSDKYLICSQGLDELGIELIREGVIDGDSAYFPEKYGEYLIPGVLAKLYGNPVPSHMFVDNVIITPNNIDEYYPE
jgi:ribose transport system substrate-binding protein